MIVVFNFIILLYCIAIFFLIYGYNKINTVNYSSLQPKTKFTIIVPFRNEAENLPILLESFSNLHYPNELFEVILVDDESKQEFILPTLNYAVKIIQNRRLSNSPKKDAITTAMQYVVSDWVVTTDADCTVNKEWLATFDNYIQLHDVSMIASAVSYACKNSFLHHFQQLDLTSLQGATIGSFGINKGFMCNGANFAYMKSLFTKLNGFEGNDKIASGDDVFLLQKAIANFPEKVHYLKSKNSIVITKPIDDWKNLFYQRVRWASKTSSYNSHFGILLGLIVFAGNLILVLGWLFSVIGIIYFKEFIFLLLSKFIVDTILLHKSNSYLNQKKIRYLIASSLLYPFFTVSVAFYSLVGKYEWKGRRF